ncbi:hypothetical protein AJ79_04401 [Helicocarpus griseus UAMH5409]|uniref:Uncharacterized protein n=1 Tax=Helicocarpus griseus UAMH5409 TaxID=1447875 RepID=A0A2B7XTX7_9EURO|nr:hypothetical protein AJ79_04401 [Helicocarpus griseus UAMH5409]
MTDKRQNPGIYVDPPVPEFRHELVGDGSIHQRYKYVQLTDPMNCGSLSGCEIAATEVEGTSTSWSVTTSLEKWIGLGVSYEIAQYAESGQVGNCAGLEYEKICTLYRFAHTAYEVNTWMQARGEILDFKRQWIASPNGNSKGNGYMCGKGNQCMSKGHYFWANFPSVVHGGPQKFPFDPKTETFNAFPLEDNEKYGGSDAENMGAGGRRPAMQKDEFPPLRKGEPS